MVIVTTMRADFLDRCLRYQSLYEIIQRQGIYMPPLKQKEIENIIVKPAQRQGFEIETGLLAQLLKDVSEEKNFLPLLEFALTLLWEKRDQDNKSLTLQAYQQLGTVGAQGLRPPNLVNPQPSHQDLGVSNRKTGLTQALNIYAEKIYQYKDYYRDKPTQERTALEKQWIKLIFLRLIRTANQEKDTRQRLPKGVLLNIVGDDATQQKALSKLIDGKYGLVSARLLVTGGDRPISLPLEDNINGFEAEGRRQEAGVNQFTSSNDDMKENISSPSPHTPHTPPSPPSPYTPDTWVDLVHEALIEGWDTFTKWREEDRELRRLGERLEEQRQEWLKNQVENNLMMGGLLMQVRQQWETLQPFLLYPKEAEVFYQRSDDYEKGKIKELADLNSNIATLRKVRNRGVIGLGIIGVIAVIVSYIGVQNVKTAQKATRIERLGVKALDKLDNHQPTQALLTAVKAGKELIPLKQNNGLYPVTSPILALNSIYYNVPKDVETLEGHQHWVINAQFSPDGEKIVTASWDKTAKVWDRKGNLLTTLEGHQHWVINAQLSQDGENIVTASVDGTVKVWDRKGNLLTTLEGRQDRVYNAQFSPDGQNIVTASRDGTAKVWQVHTLEELVAWGCEWLEGNLPSEAEEREYEEICQ
ncbi:MAG: WD40 repeat domain-containing protein [Microcystaceae cyanobacterium]